MAPKGCMVCSNCCAASWTRCWATAARPMCSTWNPAWSRSRTAGATARCIHNHTGTMGVATGVRLLLTPSDNCATNERSRSRHGGCEEEPRRAGEEPGGFAADAKAAIKRRNNHDYRRDGRLYL